MKRLAGAILVLVGVAAIGLGLLFLVGAGSVLRRYLVAVAALGVGAVAVGGGMRLWRSAQAASPEVLRAELYALAKRRNGELSQGDVAAGFGERTAAATEMARQLVREGHWQQREHEGEPFFVVPEVQARMSVTRCEFCKAELPLSHAATQCPRCGGTIRTRVERVALTDEPYRMDE